MRSHANTARSNCLPEKGRPFRGVVLRSLRNSSARGPFRAERPFFLAALRFGGQVGGQAEVLLELHGESNSAFPGRQCHPMLWHAHYRDIMTSWLVRACQFTSRPSSTTPCSNCRHAPAGLCRSSSATCCKPTCSATNLSDLAGAVNLGRPTDISRDRDDLLVDAVRVVR